MIIKLFTYFFLGVIAHASEYKRSAYSRPSSTNYPNDELGKRDIEARSSMQSNRNLYSNYKYPQDDGLSGTDTDTYTANIPENVDDGSDLVPSYTSSVQSSLLVTLTSFISSSILLSLICKMITSNTPPTSFLVVVSTACAVSCYLPGDFGDFSRALGVLLLLVAQRGNFAAVWLQFVAKAASALNMRRRTPFPQSENPWRYTYDAADPVSVDFSMTRAMMGVSVIGVLLGWSVAKQIPLLPGWIGALGGGGVFAYYSTVRDSRGDLLRFVGNTAVSSLKDVQAAGEDVQLGRKAGKLWSRASAVVASLDRKYRIFGSLRVGISYCTSFLVDTVSKLRREMEANGEERRGGLGRSEEGTDSTSRFSRYTSSSEDGYTVETEELASTSIYSSSPPPPPPDDIWRR